MTTQTPTAPPENPELFAQLQQGQAQRGTTVTLQTIEELLAPGAAGGVGRDAFGRLRVSNPTTLFDSKQIFDNQPLFWDDAEVSGASTTSTHNLDHAASIMGVAATTAGKRVRQTRQRFNYQPGKSLLGLFTGVLIASGGGSGTRQCLGYFDEENGLFFENLDGVIGVVCRSFTSGSAVDTRAIQANWNQDTLDGNGPSGLTLDLTKAQIFFIDLEWLGVGDTRFGFMIDGKFIVCHQFSNANTIGLVYMTKANLPVRYEIENDGTGAASTMEQICASIIVEGGTDEIGTVRYKSTAGAHVDANAANTLYAVVGIRLKTTHLAETIDLVAASMISETNDDFEAVILHNPTVAGTFTYADETNSAIQTALGATANTVTGGVAIGGGFAKSDAPIAGNIINALRLGSTIAGVRDQIVLCARPLSINADIQGSLTWRERS